MGLKCVKCVRAMANDKLQREPDDAEVIFEGSSLCLPHLSLAMIRIAPQEQELEETWLKQ